MISDDRMFRRQLSPLCRLYRCTIAVSIRGARRYSLQTLDLASVDLYVSKCCQNQEREVKCCIKILQVLHMEEATT